MLDREGRFWHHGALVEHAGMARAFACWIGRHPDDGRYVLNNGYDWSYFTVEDVPFFVVSVHPTGTDAESPPALELSDGTRESLDPGKLEVGPADALYVLVKGSYRARFTQHAQQKLAPWIELAPDGRVCVRVGGSSWVVPTT